MYTNQCKFCKTPFISKIKSATCPSCKELDEALFTKIEDYLAKFPNSNAIQIASGVGVSTLDVLQYIDEGRLQLSKGEFKRL